MGKILSLVFDLEVGLANLLRLPCPLLLSETLGMGPSQILAREFLSVRGSGYGLESQVQRYGLVWRYNESLCCLERYVQKPLAKVILADRPGLNLGVSREVAVIPKAKGLLFVDEGRALDFESLAIERNPAKRLSPAKAQGFFGLLCSEGALMGGGLDGLGVDQKLFGRSFYKRAQVVARCIFSAFFPASTDNIIRKVPHEVDVTGHA